ncbi:MAG: TonB family protein [Bacteroidota bacterium]
MSELKDDIEKYLKGEMSPKEMHALEKKALSDPFLADALDGGALIDQKDFSKDIEELDQSIYKKKEVFFTPLRIAAGIIIIIGAAIFLLWPSKKSELIVENKKTETPADTLKPEPANQPLTLSSEKPRLKKKTTSTQQQETEVKTAPVVTSLLEHDNDSTTIVKVEPAPVVVAKNTHVISGTVRTKEDNLALPGVTVLVKGTNRGTTTDVDGNYTLEVADTASLLFSFVGMQTNEVATNERSTIDIKMNEDVSQLSEVVIARTALPSDDEDEDGPVVRLAAPIGGVRAYNKYLESNRQYPQQALDNDVKGRVIVGFDVGSDGTISNFKVIRSLGFGCDEEVLRLVKEGAAWKPTTEDNKPVESTVHVKMKFDAVKYKKRKK